MPHEIFLFRFVQSEVEIMDAHAVSGVLEKHGIQMAHETDYIELQDGLSVEITASGMPEGALSEVALSFRGVSESLYKLVFDLMVASKGTALVVEGASIPLLTSPEHEADLPEAAFAPPVVCESWEDVRTVVERGFASWAEWAELE